VPGSGHLKPTFDAPQLRQEAARREENRMIDAAMVTFSTVTAVIEKLLEHYKKTAATGGHFLRYCGYIDTRREGNIKKLIMLSTCRITQHTFVLMACFDHQAS
jgi:hypothetical protein